MSDPFKDPISAHHATFSEQMIPVNEEAFALGIKSFGELHGGS